MQIRNLGTVARALQRLAASETKDRPKAVSVALMVMLDQAARSMSALARRR
jgi:hypothetical protein